MPLVSVIVPTYNRAHTIERALRSVLGQTLQDFEVLIVDDASTDDTAEVVGRFDDSRIQYLRHSENRFAGAARNTGMEAATGSYIAFLDSDDAWLPGKLEKQIGLLEGADRHCGCSYTGAIINAESGLTKHALYKPSHHGDALRAYLLGKFTIWTPTFVFRSELLNEVKPFDTSLIRVEDVDFYLRLLRKSQLSCVSEPMVELFLDVGKEVAQVADECDRVLLEKHKELIAEQGAFSARHIYATYEFRIGERYLNEGQVAKGLNSIGAAILQNPFMPPKRYAAMLVRLSRAVLK